LDRRGPAAGGRAGATQTVTLGVTDLMTSLAVIFALLLVVFVNASRSPAAHPEGSPASSDAAQVRAELARFSPHELILEPDPDDPQTLRVVIPESLLNFEFGKTTLTDAGDRFLARFMPRYAVALCGPLRERIAGVVIEGHTDDLGGDVLNLRLSQERSFRVLVRSLEAISASAPAAHGCFSELASASGRGKQDLVYDDRLQPDRHSSRRVVLKILLRPVTHRA
jgi:outer membrane protein OmpA-like peptidoglycan-associated protein